MIIVNWKIEFSRNWPIWADSVIESPCSSMCVRHWMQFFFREFLLALRSYDQLPGLPPTLPPLPTAPAKRGKLT